MRYVLAILFPWLCFLTLGKIIHACISLILQLSIIGWPIAAIWAFYGVREHNQQLKAKRLAQAQANQELRQTVDTIEENDEHEQR